MGSSSQDLDMGRRLRSLVNSKLSIRMDFVGFIPKDSSVPLAVARRTPVCVIAPDGVFANAIDKATERILAYDYRVNENLSFDDNDLELLKSEYMSAELPEEESEQGE